MLNNYLSDFRILKKYINHNNHIFKKNEYKNQIFLVEFNGWQGIQIAFSYLINFFSQNKKCKIIAFNSYNLFEHNEESLFRFKLKIFDIPSVKESKSRKIKADIRKATSITEAIVEFSKI